ncbi:uncharacterized protein E0L32_005628 [Thyridium curvatum]|uniref:RNA-binding protein n=1 Tax=Thyridium curvatum TaxID=1093900 RepID=A0A507BAU3_9PEZI|nr:uncharacterized protein E0L32_005628 [Thyridium curvatum]TPX13928.1 hypothetical protein E0L32_005628 [Thyridium curvatum]
MYDQSQSTSRDDAGYRRDDREHYKTRKGKPANPALHTEHSYSSPRRSPRRDDQFSRRGRQPNRRDFDEPGHRRARSSDRTQPDPSFYDDDPRYDDQDQERHGNRRGGFGRSYRSRDPDHYGEERYGYRSRGDSQDRRPRSRSPLRSETLILEGLPDDVTEKDILQGIEIIANYPEFSTDLIKAVRLRSNKRGRRIAFLEFFRAADAADFLEQHPPTISLPLPESRGLQSEPVRVGINYSRTKEDADRGGRSDDLDWTCSEGSKARQVALAGTFGSCSYSNLYFADRELQYGNGGGLLGLARDQILTGESDEEPQQLPSQYIVIRDLEPSVTEETLAKGVMKLFVEDSSPAKDSTSAPPKLKSTAPVGNTTGLGARPGSLRRVFLIRDRASKESWKYGFAEFATLDDAHGAVSKYRASPKFTIASKPVIVAFIHTGVFVPVFEPLTSRNAHIGFAPIYNPSITVKYWDDRAYPSPFIVSDEPLPDQGSPEKAADADKTAVAPGSAASDANKKLKKAKDKPAIMAPQMQMWAKKRAELHGGPKPATTGQDDDAMDYSLDRENSGPRAAHWRDTFVSYADRDSIHCHLCAKKFNTEQELRDHEVLSKQHLLNLDNIDLKIKATEKLKELDKQCDTITRRTPRDRTAQAPSYLSYADKENLVCLVCERKFKRLATLRLHERESELHRIKSGNEKNVNRAVAELAKLGQRPMRLRAKQAANQSSYRDRARERRVAFNQPKRPSGPQAAKTSAGRDGEAATPKKPANTPAPAPSKGAALLGKMGWSAGQGLGSEGTGRTEAIQTDLYMPGVGLGAEGGKLGDAAEEAARKTEGQYSSFIEKTKDKARERFEKLS